MDPEPVLDRLHPQAGRQVALAHSRRPQEQDARTRRSPVPPPSPDPREAGSSRLSSVFPGGNPLIFSHIPIRRSSFRDSRSTNRSRNRTGVRSSRLASSNSSGNCSAVRISPNSRQRSATTSFEGRRYSVPFADPPGPPSSQQLHQTRILRQRTLQPIPRRQRRSRPCPVRRETRHLQPAPPTQGRRPDPIRRRPLVVRLVQQQQRPGPPPMPRDLLTTAPHVPRRPPYIHQPAHPRERNRIPPALERHQAVPAHHASPPHRTTPRSTAAAATPRAPPPKPPAPCLPSPDSATDPANARSAHPTTGPAPRGSLRPAATPPRTTPAASGATFPLSEPFPARHASIPHIRAYPCRTGSTPP